MTTSNEMDPVITIYRTRKAVPEQKIKFEYARFKKALEEIANGEIVYNCARDEDNLMVGLEQMDIMDVKEFARTALEGK